MVESLRDDDHPVEVFKRSTAACVRAMSGERELEVTYGAEAPSLSLIHISEPTRPC